MKTHMQQYEAEFKPKHVAHNHLLREPVLGFRV
jgi:hypothetical protein